MTAAQKKAKDNFKKAIAYRKKTGCTLKQAFSHVYGKKAVGAVKKKAAPKKAAPKKKAAVKKKAAPKKKAAKNKKAVSYHKDSASHNVRINVVSGIGKINKNLIKELDFVQNKIQEIETARKNFVYYKKDLIKKEGKAYYNTIMMNSKKLLTEYKKHKTELKKLI